LEYRAGGGGPMRSYETTEARMRAIYASDKFSLGLDGVLLVGY
jgi:hypothetical protein